MITYQSKRQMETTLLDGECIILNPEDLTVTKLNEVGGYCWSLLKEEQTLDSMKEALLTRYNQSPELVVQDLDEFLQELISCGLVEYASK